MGSLGGSQGIGGASASGGSGAAVSLTFQLPEASTWLLTPTSAPLSYRLSSDHNPPACGPPRALQGHLPTQGPSPGPHLQGPLDM